MSAHRMTSEIDPLWIRFEFIFRDRQHFKRIDTAAVAISGIELAAKIRKGQFKVGKLPGRPTTVPAIWAAVVAA